MPRNSLRTNKTHALYQWAKINKKLRPLWEVEPLWSYRFFKVIPNDYPHDRVAEIHHMLIPKRKVKLWQDLRWYEVRELKKIDRTLSNSYHAINRNYPAYMSVPDIVHWHLYIYKDV